MLIKLGHGASINPDNLKYITVDAKRLGGKLTFIVTLRVDDNTDHPIAYFTNKEDAVALVASCVKKINDAS